MPDEFPLNVFYEALRKKLAGTIESTRGMTGATTMTDKPVVVVLGAGMGGRGVAQALAPDAHLVIVDVALEPAQKACDIAIAAGGTADAVVVNLTDLAAVQQFCADLVTEHGHVDAVIHLVGGWRGSPTVDAEAIDQWNQLVPGIVGTVQTTTVAFLDTLAAAPNGRYMMVTSTSVQNPKKSNAAYAAAKSAAESWVRSTGDAFQGTDARAYILAVSALVDQAARDANPDKTFASSTDTVDLGMAIGRLLTDGSLDNGAYIDLRPNA